MIVDTDTGKIEGLEKDGVAVFRGVPFAAAPVGDRRFRPPAPVEPWSGVRAATAWGPPAPQISGIGELGSFDYSNWSEDCLTLNVWTPGCDDARRPVMVWVHGGSFVTGSGATPAYSGSRLARRGDVVVVTINYRLGPFGFIGHPDLVDDESGSTGNWALLDQLAALEWVQRNIESFGGDSLNVTVFGESAGSMCSLALLASPRAGGLFHRMIGQSGPPVAGTVDDAAGVAERLAHAMGLTSVADLRTVDAAEILAAQERSSLSVLAAVALAFKPTIDGVVLDRPPFAAIADGVNAGIPLMVGSNLDEMRLFLMPFMQAVTLDEGFVRDRVADTVGSAERADHVIEVYRTLRERRGDATFPPDLWSAIETDRFFRIPAARVAELHGAHGGEAHVYLFTHPSPALGGLLGSCHALEIPFVFGTHDIGAMEQFCGAGPDVERLAANMQDAWIAFARTGSPAQPGLDWPAYDEASRRTMVFGTAASRVEPDPFADEREFWYRTLGDDVAPEPPREAVLERLADLLGGG